MKRALIIVLLCCSCSFLFSRHSNEPVKNLIEDFVSNDWPTVYVAKEKIENMGYSAFSEIFKLFNDCRVIKLKNTGDLIYPGAQKFFGHGQIIDYDIDNLCTRAGWLLEDLTFKDFGFSGVHLPANELSDYIQTNFPGYVSVEANREQLAQLSEEDKRKLIRNLSIANAKNWWESASLNWDRLSALTEALNSEDERSQVKALFYLRNGKTNCKGLTEKYYKTHFIKPIEKLSKSITNRVSENAKLIMLDSDFSWLSIKPVN